MACSTAHEFTPRGYQVELFQAAMEENIIVYLPTGSGKTFIAALLIKEKSSEIVKPLVFGGKRTVFLVPTIVLAIQQAAYLKRHTHLKVKEYYGSMGVDMWGKNKWEQEFEENHILVMTAQVFVDILNHAFFSVHQLNLLVFDECHAAVKDAPMKQVLLKLRSCSTVQRPKILGLTAALFRKRCKPQKVRQIIQSLSESMDCVVKVPSDVDLVFCSSTKPCETIFQYGNNAMQNRDAQYLSITIKDMVLAQIQLFTPVYGEDASKEDFVPTKHADKVDVLLDALKDIIFLLESFGPYGAFHCALVYINILQSAKFRAKVPQFAMDLEKVCFLCKRIRELCTPYFERYSLKDRLLLFVQPRVIRLLEIIRKFNPEEIAKESFNTKFRMCAIIFVERRCMANVLYHFVKEIRQHDETLGFVKPLFIMGQAAGRNASLKETHILNMKHKDIMGRFREGICNLLVATSVLEEGIDIPACNLIVRFDRIKTYCDYVQTKGRARSMKAFFCILVSEDETQDCLDDLAQFHGIEQQLLATDNFEDDISDAIENLFARTLPPYSPYGNQGPQVTLQSSISLVNRYCSQLSSDKDVVLVPQWKIKKVDESDIEPGWLERIKDICKDIPFNFPSSSKHPTARQKLPTNTEKNLNFFRCSIILPLNSPLREEIVGDVMPTKRLAKRAVALKACIALHQLKELDDAHLLPVTKIILTDIDEDLLVDEESAQHGHGKTVVYDRQYPACFVNCRPLLGQSSFIYSIDFTLLKPSQDKTKLYFPFAVETKFAVLTSQLIPAICPFPLTTRAGDFQVNLCGVDSVILDESQLDQLYKFHRFVFENVIFLWERQLQFDLELSKLQYLIVPLQTTTDKIDFDLVNKMTSAPEIDWEKPPFSGDNFQFNPSVFADAVVVPSHKPFGRFNTFYVDCISDLTPLSPFLGKEFVTYESYFLLKHDRKLTNLQQQLIGVSREITGKNFLIPRSLSTTKEQATHFIPELCFVHPLPASVWKQAVWIPSVLHRLHGMLVAEELRVRISTEAKIGIEFLPAAVNISTVWRPLESHHKRNYRSENRSAPGPRPLMRSLKSSTLKDKTELDINFMWNFEYDESNKEATSDNSMDMSTLAQVVATANTSSPSSSASSSRSSSSRRSLTEEQLPDSIEDQRKRWVELASMNSSDAVLPSKNQEIYNVSFDVADPNLISDFGPSPGLILEALTLAKAHDGFDLERMETIGDSILKLTISIYVYGETSNDRCDEGRLTLMRTHQINNKHLFNLGSKKGIGQLIVAQSFDLKANYLPSCFQTPVSESEPNLHVQQSVSKKNVADCMEALIGVYLLTTGIKGSIKLMNWMGLKTVPKFEVIDFNQKNGFPILTPTHGLNLNQTENEEIARLYSGLETFEKRLGYTFKHKNLLIEALSHASYLPNRVTNCYQRLEFLGDAVLDYLVTRFYYDNPCRYSPAILTDLRSAMVNNQTFAVIAVKNHYHLYLKHLSMSLNLIVDRFVQTQEENGHMLMHDYFVLEETDIPKERMASNIDVPKVLGDIFESVAGAIFVDSGMSLDAVWKSYLPFLHESLDLFDKNTPISAMRALHEQHPSALKFKKPENLSDGRICVSIEVGDAHVFKGAGGNSKTAKSAAAKYALSVLTKKRT